MSTVERLVRWIASVSSARFRVQVVEPVLADLQHELSGLTAARSRLARQLGAVWALLTAGAWYAITGARAVRSVTAFIVTTVALTLVVAWVTFPPLLGHGRALQLYIHLLPQAFSVAIVVGFGIALGTLGRPAVGSTREIALVWAGAIAVALVVALTLQTITPTHNQAFREALFGGHPTRGANELTWQELFDQVRDRGHADFVQARTFPSATFWFHNRLALVTLPVILLLLHRSVRRRSTVLISVAGLLAWWTVVPPSQIAAVIEAGIPGALIAWLPNGALLVACALTRRTRHQP